ncbi:transmembrane protein 87A [Latimeria chalumnae]|uniref:transmembrane protein 87A n=1 Tax=Latimeria chalumnae TaxID=7897 RepID=UPI00313CCFA6
MAAAKAKTVGSSLVLLLLFLLLCVVGLGAAAEISRWRRPVGPDNVYSVFRKTLFNGTVISIKFEGDEKSCDPSLSFNVTWYLRYSRCYNEVFNTGDELADVYFGSDQEKRPGWSGSYAQSSIFSNCTELFKPKQMSAVARSWEDGPYFFIVKIEEMSGSEVQKKVSDNSGVEQGVLPSSNAPEKNNWAFIMAVEMNGPYEYTSPADWPLMIFFMVMCIVYVVFGTLWLIWSACYWRDLLRIQFWIGAVIFLGMLEKAVFYAEFQSIRYKGESVQGAVILAEVLSAVKRSLARILVIIVSLGYGIVKPRLGAMLHRVVAVGVLYLLFSALEGILRVTGEQSDLASLAFIPLAVLDTALCWWIFISLSQTMKMLKLRRNVVKLSLYRHFTNTLVFVVAASIIFIIWTTKKFKLADCQSDWQELWIDDAFWRLLFSVILFVIMFLWRPSANNQRFAYSPLTEEDEDSELKEPMLNEAFEGMKMRGTKPETNGNPKPSKVDEDLKWVEENVPSSMADVALPALLDSDEVNSDVVHGGFWRGGKKFFFPLGIRGHPFEKMQALANPLNLVTLSVFVNSYPLIERALAILMSC